MNEDLLGDLAAVMHWLAQSWARLDYAPQAKSDADQQALTKARQQITDAMNLIRPVRHRLKNEAATQHVELHLVQPHE